ncbi:hypothetical protein CO615_06670 [Lysobacteraceae bacterium NML75-0749]|nr:hypothetical protein CO615_06670 [Xanthomonadaceae bacterium NML75-0749]
MSTPLNLTHQQAAALAGIVKDWLDEAAADLRAKRLHEAAEKLQIAQANLKKLQAALAEESPALVLLREIHAAWALANHVPSDTPGSWESQMMRKIERLLGIAQEAAA